MSIPCYKAFNLDDAKNGAPFKTRGGQTVTVIEWDGKNADWPILAYYGTSNKVGQWDSKGNCLSHTPSISPMVLVMAPLGFIGGDPVYTGDLVKNAGVTVHADPKMRDFSACHWPSGKGQTTALPLIFEHNLTQVYKMLGVNEYTEALDEIGSLQTAASSLRSIQDVLGVSSYAGAMQVISHLRAEIKSKSALNDNLSAQIDQAITERDHNCDTADNLANAISKTFSRDIGEHSNVNCPWEEALAIVEDASGKMFVAESVVLDVAAGVFEEALHSIVVTMSKGQVHTSHGANIRELMADAFAVLRRDQAAGKAQETESETKNPAGFGHG